MLIRVQLSTLKMHLVLLDDNFLSVILLFTSERHEYVSIQNLLRLRVIDLGKKALHN